MALSTSCIAGYSIDSAVLFPSPGYKAVVGLGLARIGRGSSEAMDT